MRKKKNRKVLLISLAFNICVLCSAAQAHLLALTCSSVCSDMLCFNCFNTPKKQIPCSLALYVKAFEHSVNFILITFGFICSFSCVPTVFPPKPILSFLEIRLYFFAFCYVRMSLMMDIPTFTRYYFQSKSKCCLQLLVHMFARKCACTALHAC